MKIDFECLKAKVNEILDDFEKSLQRLSESKKNLKRLRMLETIYVAILDEEDVDLLEKRRKVERKDQLLDTTQRYNKLLEMCLTSKSAASNESIPRNPNYTIVPMHKGGNYSYQVVGPNEPQELVKSSSTPRAEITTPTELTPKTSYTLSSSNSVGLQPERLSRKS